MKSPYRVSNKQSFTHNASWIAFSTVSFTTQSAALSIQPEEGQRPWLIQKWLRHDLLWLSLTSLATIEFISLSFRAPDQRVDLTVPIFFLPKTGNNRVKLWIHDLNLNPQYNWHIYPLKTSQNLGIGKREIAALVGLHHVRSRQRLSWVGLLFIALTHSAPFQAADYIALDPLSLRKDDHHRSQLM